jgi:truncated hemoglobin YjbI
VTAIIDLMFVKVQHHHIIQNKFKNVDVNKVKIKLKSFWAKEFGCSTIQYDGRPLAETHKALNITNEEFDLFGSLMLESCAELQIASTDLPKIRMMYDRHRSVIVAK